MPTLPTAGKRSNVSSKCVCAQRSRTLAVEPSGHPSEENSFANPCYVWDLMVLACSSYMLPVHCLSWNLCKLMKLSR